MRAGKRLSVAIWAAGLMLWPAPLVAQTVPDAPASTPTTDAVGPRELQNFSLSGTVTRPADKAPPAIAAPAKRSAKAPAVASQAVPEPSAAPRSELAATARRPAETPAENKSPPQSLTETASLAPVAPPPVESTPAASTAPVPAFSSAVAPLTAAVPATLSPEQGPLLWPWLLAALALAAGAMFRFLRGRARPALAGGPQFDRFVAPVPEPTPAPASRSKTPEPATPPPAPPRVAAPKPATGGGIVSTGLRPWLELGMQPLRCILDEQQVTLEFELELFNSGSAPARAVLIEASLFNAGPTQEQDIGAFMARPVGQGERMDALQPLTRMALRTQVAAPRQNVQVLEVAGRQVFVPLIAFNLLYRWGGREGQTSLAYLVGRDTKGEKLAPFRADLGPRVFRGLGARPLPNGVRR